MELVDKADVLFMHHIDALLLALEDFFLSGSTYRDRNSLLLPTILGLDHVDTTRWKKNALR